MTTNLCKRCEDLRSAYRVATGREPPEFDQESELNDEETRASRNWAMLALVVGYNEFAKNAKTLGEKVYFRIARDAAEKNLVEHGGEPLKKLPVEGGNEVVVIRESMPRIAFEQRDIELMRQVVYEYDQASLRSDIRNALQPMIALLDECESVSGLGQSFSLAVEEAREAMTRIDQILGPVEGVSRS